MQIWDFKIGKNKTPGRVIACQAKQIRKKFKEGKEQWQIKLLLVKK